MMAYGIILSGQCPDCHRHAGQAWCGAKCASEPAYKGSWGPGRVAVVYDTPPAFPAVLDAGFGSLEAPSIPVVYVAGGDAGQPAANARLEGEMVTEPAAVRWSKPVKAKPAVTEPVKAKPAKPASVKAGPPLAGRAGKR